jgi:CBS domain-containing protein
VGEAGLPNDEPVVALHDAEAAAISLPGDDASAGTGPDFLYRVNSVLPESQLPATVEPGTRCVAALEQMEADGFSQLPIMMRREVLGLFSYRSFSRAAIDANTRTIATLTVEEAMEDAIWVRATDELRGVIDLLERCDVVLVGAENDLQGVLTMLDVIRHLDALGEPYVRFREIEHALRALVAEAVDADRLATIAKDALATEYASRADEPPSTCDEMTLGQLVSVTMHGENWRYFKATLGANRAIAQTHLVGLAPLRNDVFHFRRPLDGDELQRIQTASEWLRQRVRASGLMPTQRGQDA